MDETTQRPPLGDQMDLIESLVVAYLSTVDDEGFPQTRAVFNLRCRSHFFGLAPLFAGHDDDFLLYFTTNTSSRKVVEIRARPHVCAYFCHPGEAHGVMLTGICELVEDPAIKNTCWQEGWERYYPGGRTDPDYAILRMRPRRMKGWYRDRSFSVGLPAPG